MKIEAVQRAAAALACLSMLVQPALAASPVPASGVADIALGEGGLLTGRVVNAQGAPIVDTAVSLQQAGEEVAATVTNEEGVFAVRGLRGGLYQVVSDGGVVTYRLWAPNTAPPAANQAALVVTGQEILAGQYGPHQSGGGGLMGWVREHPLLVAAGIATAIAVPIAVADDDDDSAS